MSSMGRIEWPQTPAAKEQELVERYPDVRILPGTLNRDPGLRYQYISILCSFPGCDQARRIRTSDLFQVRYCKEHALEVRRTRARAEQARKRALRRAYKKLHPGRPNDED